MQRELLCLLKPMTIRNALFLLLFLVSFLSRAQDISVVDSLRVELKKTADPMVVTSIYEQLAWEFRKAYPDSTIYYANKSVELIKDEGLPRNIAQALTFIGVAYQYKGDNLKSFDFYSEAKEVALNFQDTLQFAHALNSLGRLYFNQGSFLKAYDHFYEALKHFNSLSDLQGSAYVYKSLSELYRSQNNYVKAEEMAKKTLEIREKLGDVTGQISVLVELAAIYVERQNYNKAVREYEKALRVAESISDEVGVARVELGISQVHSKMDQDGEAFTYAQLAMKKLEGSNNEELLNQVRLRYAESLMAVEKYNDAKEVLNEIVLNENINKLLSIEKEAHLRLSEIYEFTKNTAMAFRHFKRYAELKEAWSNAQMARDIQRLESRIVLETKEKENELLRLNEARSVAVIERQRLANIALVAVVTLIGVFLIGIWYAGRKRKQMFMKLQVKNRQIEEQADEISKQNDQIQRQNQKLQTRNEQLAELNNEKDTLMNIVAHDLKSPINRVKGIADLLNFTELDKEQANYVELLKQITNNSTDLIRDLLDVNAFEGQVRKLNITEVSLTELIHTKHQAFLMAAKSKKIEMKLSLPGEQVFIKTDSSLLVRVIDNLLSNAIKFSNANTVVCLSIQDQNKAPVLIIKDQGPGFTTSDKQQLFQKFKKLSARPTAGESSNGLGLAIVKILCDRLGINIELETEIDSGSSFVLLFPEEVKPL